MIINHEKEKKITWGQIGVKAITVLMALGIVYISVMGFTSLLGGLSGKIIGGIFGLAEFAFIMYFPSTIHNWKNIPIISRSVLLIIVMVLGVLSFASTHSYITKNINNMTSESDQGQQAISFTESKIKKIEVNKNNLVIEKDKLKALDKELYLRTEQAIERRDASANQLRVIIFNGGKQCVGDCAARKQTGENVVLDSRARVQELKDEKNIVVKRLQSKIDKIESLEKREIVLNDNLYSEKQNELKYTNTKELYAGYETVGSQMNDIFGTDRNPIEMFTTTVSLILYALYILLTIWLYGVINPKQPKIKKAKRSFAAKLRYVIRSFKTKRIKNVETLVYVNPKIQRERDAFKAELDAHYNATGLFSEMDNEILKRDLILAKMETRRARLDTAFKEGLLRSKIFFMSIFKYIFGTFLVLLFMIGTLITVVKVTDYLNVNVVPMMTELGNNYNEAKLASSEVEVPELTTSKKKTNPYGYQY